MAALNRIVHERARLLILTYLASDEQGAATFNELQQRLDLTSGNLSIQLKKLKKAGYLTIRKTFKNNKPLTTVSITPGGREALTAYLDEMEAIIRALKP